jgi:outer membrane protein assembly factor BamB
MIRFLRRFPLQSKRMLFIGALLALVLTACGPARTQTWPGLATNGELVFLAENTHVYAVPANSTTGQETWRFPPEGYTGNAGIFVADPGVGDDILVVGSEGPAGQYSGVLYGLDPETGVDPATGKARWCLAFDQKGADREGCTLAQGGTQAGFLGFSRAVDNRIISGVTVTNGVAYVGLASGAVFAVDAATGRDLWRFQAERDVWATPQVAGDLVIVASLDHHVYGLDAATGAERWSQDMGAALAGSPTLSEDGETVYVGTFGSQLWALNAADGETKWFKSTTNWVWSAPALAEGVLYFTDVSGMVYAVDAETGDNVWTPFAPGGQMRGRPALAGDLVYVGDRQGNLYAIDRATGAVRHTSKVDGQVLASPEVAADRLLVAPFGGDNLLVGLTLDFTVTPLAFAPSR